MALDLEVQTKRVDVYVPLALDAKLRLIALHKGVGLNQMMSDMLKAGMQALDLNDAPWQAFESPSALKQKSILRWVDVPRLIYAKARRLSMSGERDANSGYLQLLEAGLPACRPKFNPAFDIDWTSLPPDETLAEAKARLANEAFTTWKMGLEALVDAVVGAIDAERAKPDKQQSHRISVTLPGVYSVEAVVTMPGYANIIAELSFTKRVALRPVFHKGDSGWGGDSTYSEYVTMDIDLKARALPDAEQLVVDGLKQKIRASRIA